MGLETPCWIVDRDRFLRNINAAKRCGTVAYSVKTNWLPGILTTVLHAGCMAEVVSADEWRLARLCGFAPDNIVYNGPLKSRETFAEAITGGSIVNIECRREVLWLKEIAAHIPPPVKIGVRVNVNVSDIAPEEADCEDDDSRFGFDDGNGELAEALSVLRGIPNVIPAGLHFHRSTNRRRVNMFRKLAAIACRMVEKHRLWDTLEYLDFGGGYWAPAPGKPTFDHYANAIRGVLARCGLDDKRVIVEPGTGIVSTAVSFLTEVIDIKKVGDDKIFVCIDGSRNDIDSYFKKKDYKWDIIPCGSGKDAVTARRQIICGCSCLERDRFFEMHDSRMMEVGDRLIFSNAGAYTMSLAPLFIRQFAPVYIKEGRQYVLARDAWTAEKWML